MIDFDFEEKFKTETVEFDCDKHGKSNCNVYVNFGKSEPYCSECEKEKEHEEKVARHRENMQSKVRSCGIPELFLKKTYKEFLTNGIPEKQAALDAVKNYGEGFEVHLANGENLILVGGLGTGKTHISSCLAKQLTYANYSIDFSTLANIVRRVRATWKDSSRESEDAVFKYYEKLDLLIIDEVGVGAGSDNERNIAYEIINRRYCAMKPTVVISNCNTELMGKYIDERSVSRLYEKGKVLVMNWGDYRRLGAEQ